MPFDFVSPVDGRQSPLVRSEDTKCISTQLELEAFLGTGTSAFGTGAAFQENCGGPFRQFYPCTSNRNSWGASRRETT